MKTLYYNRFAKLLLMLFICLSLVACASQHPTPGDPFEKMNRGIFRFNRGIDKVLVRPVAIGYQRVIPSPARKGVSNFFSNLSELPSIANYLLQGNLYQANAATWRFMFNSTIGIGGLFDVATPLGIAKKHTDAGLTFAKWGMTKSPYLVIPIFGPSTLRDGAGLAVDGYVFTVWSYLKPAVRNSLFAVSVINERALLLKADDIIEQAAIDPYVFVRDAYLQKRNHQIHGDKDTDDVFIEDKVADNAFQEATDDD